MAARARLRALLAGRLARYATDRELHEPWKKAPPGYPAPVVEHGFARARALFAELRRP